MLSTHLLSCEDSAPVKLLLMQVTICNVDF